jgi:hypothetical protein
MAAVEPSPLNIRATTTPEDFPPKMATGGLAHYPGTPDFLGDHSTMYPNARALSMTRESLVTRVTS